MYDGSNFIMYTPMTECLCTPSDGGAPFGVEDDRFPRQCRLDPMSSSCDGHTLDYEEDYEEVSTSRRPLTVDRNTANASFQGDEAGDIGSGDTGSGDAGSVADSAAFANGITTGVAAHAACKTCRSECAGTPAGQKCIVCPECKADANGNVKCMSH